MKRFVLALIILVLVLGLLPAGSFAEDKTLTMATTTSTDNTGLLDYLAPKFSALIPSGMIQLAFVGNTTDTEKWTTCEEWLAKTWTGWIKMKVMSYPMIYHYYALVKAMRLAKPNPVSAFEVRC